MCFCLIKYTRFIFSFVYCNSEIDHAINYQELLFNYSCSVVVSVYTMLTLASMQFSPINENNNKISGPAIGWFSAFHRFQWWLNVTRGLERYIPRDFFCYHVLFSTIYRLLLIY